MRVLGGGEEARGGREPAGAEGQQEKGQQLRRVTWVPVLLFHALNSGANDAEVEAAPRHTIGTRFTNMQVVRSEQMVPWASGGMKGVWACLKFGWGSPLSKGVWASLPMPSLAPCTSWRSESAVCVCVFASPNPQIRPDSPHVPAVQHSAGCIAGALGTPSGWSPRTWPGPSQPCKPWRRGSKRRALEQGSLLGGKWPHLGNGGGGQARRRRSPSALTLHRPLCLSRRAGMGWGCRVRARDSHACLTDRWVRSNSDRLAHSRSSFNVYGERGGKKEGRGRERDRWGQAGMCGPIS